MGSFLTDSQAAKWQPVSAPLRGLAAGTWVPNNMRPGARGDGSIDCDVHHESLGDQESMSLFPTGRARHAGSGELTVRVREHGWGERIRSRAGACGPRTSPTRPSGQRDQANWDEYIAALYATEAEVRGRFVDRLMEEMPPAEDGRDAAAEGAQVSACREIRAATSGTRLPPPRRRGSTMSPRMLCSPRPEGSQR